MLKDWQIKRLFVKIKQLREEQAAAKSASPFFGGRSKLPSLLEEIERCEARLAVLQGKG